MIKHFVIAAPCPKANGTILKFILYNYCIFVSSIHRRVIGIHFSICFINKKGNINNENKEQTGPNIEPCGTPDFTSCIEECVFFFFFFFVCFFSTFCQRGMTASISANDYQIYQNIVFLVEFPSSTTSNAFRRSKNTAPVISPLSILFSHLSKRLIRAVL